MWRWSAEKRSSTAAGSAAAAAAALDLGGIGMWFGRGVLREGRREGGGGGAGRLGFGVRVWRRDNREERRMRGCPIARYYLKFF
jgi:hypothetical protein